jgi:AAA+ ATPase superfamily predicted ATPase
MTIIGRKREIGIFKKILASEQAEFLAVYGRRRVGKTFLIQQCSKDAGFYFECTGIKDGKLQAQLENFIEVFAKRFYPGLTLQRPKSWKEAFQLLTDQVEKMPQLKLIIFFDELPWLASRRSEFMETLDHFWNTKWVHFSNLKLITCGSAASWMLNNLINAKGGLHNRITRSILLEPFTLEETKEFLESKNVSLSNNHILSLYLIMGGIPYYLNHIDRSKSISQNINEICFKKDGLLYGEFPRLFKSLFEAAELNLQIVKEIAKHRYGISFTSLVENMGKKAGGRFKERLEELEATGFIQGFLPYGKNKRGHFYKVIDEYTFFYLRWIEELVSGKILPKGIDYWEKIRKSPAWFSFAGYAFESVCYKHTDKIIEALNLSGIGCFVSHWQHRAKRANKANMEIGQGAEIDLLLDRSDDAITICEIKYTSSPFVIDKTVAKNLMQKTEVFQKQTKTPKQLFIAIITAVGLTENIWTKELAVDSVSLDDLFK